MAFIDLGISGLQPFAYESLTVTNAVKTLTQATAFPANEPPARAALITFEAQPIRVTLDGTTPVASTGPGHQFNDKDAYVARQRQEIVKFKAIRDGATDGTLRVTYFR